MPPQIPPFTALTQRMAIRKRIYLKQGIFRERFCYFKAIYFVTLKFASFPMINLALTLPHLVAKLFPLRFMGRPWEPGSPCPTPNLVPNVTPELLIDSFLILS